MDPVLDVVCFVIGTGSFALITSLLLVLVFLPDVLNAIPFSRSELSRLQKRIEALEDAKQQRAGKDRLAADAQRWANIRSAVIRLDAQSRPGLPMGDDDIEGLALQVLEHAARKSGRTHNSSALPGAVNAS